jgi:hypothetical protein
MSIPRLSFPTILYLLTRFTLPIAYLVNLDHDLRALQVSLGNLFHIRLTQILPTVSGSPPTIKLLSIC